MSVKAATHKTVPVSDPAHPSHPSWLEALLLLTRMAASIGPVVVAVADPDDAKLATDLGKIAGAALDGVGKP